MEIIFSNHANLKINQRELSRDFIIKTINSPDFTRPTRGFREERYKYFGKNWLKVIVIKESDKIVVITAHWIAKIS